jgi:hypothetical protein
MIDRRSSDACTILKQKRQFSSTVAYLYYSLRRSAPAVCLFKLCPEKKKKKKTKTKKTSRNIPRNLGYCRQVILLSSVPSRTKTALITVSIRMTFPSRLHTLNHTVHGRTGLKVVLEKQNTALNDIDILSANIGWAYLNASTKERVHTTAGLEF